MSGLRHAVESLLTTINPSFIRNPGVLQAAHCIGKWIGLIPKTPVLSSHLFCFVERETTKVRRSMTNPGISASSVHRLGTKQPERSRCCRQLLCLSYLTMLLAIVSHLLIFLPVDSAYPLDEDDCGLPDFLSGGVH